MEKLSPKLVNFASILEPKTRSQAFEASKMPFIYPYMALMPDAHLGKGATVGSVIPTLGAIMPAAVGVDIGCGMMAVRTQWTKDDIDARVGRVQKFGMEPDMALHQLHKNISSSVPLSAGAKNDKVSPSASRRIAELEDLPGIAQAEQALPHWRMQLGSLGSGNHFIELSYDEVDQVWLFLHSGSRGIGNKLASKHIKIAQEMSKNEKLPNPDLAFLIQDTNEFWDYIEALRWAQRFALLNREEMMLRVEACMILFMGETPDRQQVVNCHHNYTVQEKIAGLDVWLSRKGAIDASAGTWGLIPGSMGDKSYVVQGKGNPDSLNSAPHGAGRNFSRSAAKKEFTLDDLNKRMTGIVWGESANFLDEHPSAYKPIDQVMKDAEDLIEVKHEFRQFLNVKGN